MRRMHGELWDWAMHAGNSAALNTLHQYACRVGTSEDGTLIDALVAQMMISRECKSLQKSALAPSHQQAVSKLQALQSQVNVDLKTISQNNTFMNTIGKKQGLLDFLKSRSATYYLKLVNKIFPQFDRIAKFDFTTMSFHP
jgi:hypothetical protein